MANNPVVPLMQRLWARIDVRGPDECWPWTGALNGGGYPVIREGPGGSPLLYCHRLVLEEAIGRRLEPGEESCHSCDHPPCCNPGHLFAGDRQANVADCVAKGRTNRGERNSAAKLTEAEAIAVLADTRPASVVAAEFGIATSHVYAIRARRTWRHLKATA